MSMDPSVGAHPPKSSQTIGVVLVLVWVALSASKDVYLGHLVQDIDPILMLVVCIAITLVVFNATQVPDLGSYTGALRANALDVFWLNLFTAVAWGSFFAALRFLEAAVAESFVVAVDPLATICLARALRRESLVLPSELAASWGMLAAAAFLGVGVWYGHSSVGALSPSDATFGIGCVLLCGVANGGITVVSKRLADRKVTTSQVMASRFFLLLAGCLVFLVIRAPAIGPLFDEAGGVLLIGVFGVIAPMFVVQKAIERTEPITVVLVGSIVPVAAFGFQQLDHRLQFSWLSFTGAAAIALVVVAGTYRRLRTGGTGKITESPPVPHEAGSRAAR
jgi:drug/metabolite transporter (DMT)-like permease